jgi:hypothetical protein
VSLGPGAVLLFRPLSAMGRLLAGRLFVLGATSLRVHACVIGVSLVCAGFLMGTVASAL